MLLTRKEAAQYLNIGTRTIDRLKEIGLLRWVDLRNGGSRKPMVRFNTNDLDAYVESVTLGGVRAGK